MLLFADVFIFSHYIAIEYCVILLRVGSRKTLSLGNAQINLALRSLMFIFVLT